MKSVLLGLALSVLLGCGATDPTLRGSCATSCDCDQSGNAPVKCAGEWLCNPQKACQYTCKNICGGGGVSTCPDPQECNGSVCSDLVACRKR